MTTRWNQIKRLCGEALELDDAARAAFLDRACGADDALRREVESILGASAAAPTHFDTPAADIAGNLLDDADAAMIGRVVGAYRLIRCIARGGMGAVFLGQRCDGDFEQQVAVKLIRQRVQARESLLRFQIEKQALAALNHPNIARLYDGGITGDGQPYLAMEFVEGVSIDVYCSEKRLSARETLALFQSANAAVLHVHQNLILHRDLKPGNILVTRNGVPKLVDFGIAKLLERPSEKPSATMTGAAHPFTPAYASPEQVRGDPVTTASDVYSLGAILYLLLTGENPHGPETQSAYELSRHICEIEPRPPSTALRTSGNFPPGLNSPAQPDRQRRARQLAGDIDAIVMKALAKGPAQRYASVEQFADDIRCYLSGLPVAARRGSVGYQLGKALRRHRVAAIGTAAVIASLASGVAATVWQARIAVCERDSAEKARRVAVTEASNAQRSARKAQRVTRFLQDVLTAANPSQRGRDVKIADVLDEAASKIETDFAQDPEMASGVLNSVGLTYHGLGRLAEAERHQKRALELLRLVHPGDHAEVAAVIGDLVTVQFARGDFAAAMSGAIEALEMQQRLDGPRSALVAKYLSSLGAVYRAAGDLERAETLLNEARAIRESLPEIDPAELATTLNNLGMVKFRQGKNAEAAELSQRVLDLRIQSLGPQHPLSIQALDNLAITTVLTGDQDRAEAMMWQSVALHRKVLGDGHPELAIALANLGSLLTSREHPGLAEPLLREALATNESALPAAHPRIARARFLLGECLLKMNRWVEAEPLLLNAHAAYCDRLGPRHRDTIDAARMLVELNLALGRNEAAACLATESEPDD